MSVRNSDDIVDVLVSQHEQLGSLFAEVRAATGDDRKVLFGELTDLLHAHEHGERIVVHPVTHDRTRGGAGIAESHIAAEDVIGRQAAELQDLGLGDPGFGAKLTALEAAVRDHNAAEERDEFPHLRRFVPTQRLHLMANELRNVQTMR
jgi:hypothetical protein